MNELPIAGTPRKVDTSESLPAYLLNCMDGRALKLSPSAHFLVQSVRDGQSFAMIAERLSRQGRPVEPADVERAYLYVAGRIQRIESRKRSELLGFWFVIPCIPASLVTRIARPLSAAFERRVAGALVLGLALMLPTMAAHGLSAGLQGAALIPAYLLYLASVIAHELGHASGSMRYGAPPSAIGVALYLCYPVFYTDVNRAWQLKRWQRVVVDCGGIYFQLVVAAAYTLVYLVYGWEPLRIAVVLVLGSCLLSLNPFLKFDGYWIVADGLGVTNLGKQTLQLLRVFLDRLRSRPARPLPWPPRIAAMLAVYLGASACFWTSFVAYLAPIVWRDATGYLPLVVAAIDALGRPPYRLPGAQWESLLRSSLLLGVLILACMRVARSLGAAVRKRLR